MHMCAHMCIHVHAGRHDRYVHSLWFIYTLHVCKHVFAHMCASVCIQAHACLRVCMYAHMCLQVLLHTCVLEHMYVCVSLSVVCWEQEGRLE